MTDRLHSSQVFVRSMFSLILCCSISSPSTIVEELFMEKVLCELIFFLRPFDFRHLRKAGPILTSVLVSRDREGLSICVNFDGGYGVDTYD